MLDLSKNLVDLLKDLIAIESETGNEKELCDILYKTLEPVNGELVRVQDSIVLHLNFGKEKRVALVGHIDTVPVASSSIIPQIKDGELWGRGACDMKSGLACMLKILYDISKGNLTPIYNLSFIFYQNEEGSLPNGINFLLDMGALKEIDFSYILEPTEGRYSVGCLGSLTVKKEIYGVSAHSANARKGRSALIESMEICKKIEDLNASISQDANINNLTYYETINITTLNTTNTTFNVIPGKLDMVINYRFGPNRNLKEAMDILFNTIGKENTTIIDDADSCYIGNSGDTFLKPEVEREIMQAWTDIAQLNAAGIPSINFCAGSIKYAHKSDERINITELEEYYQLLKSHL